MKIITTNFNTFSNSINSIQYFIQDSSLNHRDSVKGKLRDFFYMLAKYVPGNMKYIFTNFYRHSSTNNEANRKFVILISNFSWVVTF